MNKFSGRYKSEQAARLSPRRSWRKGGSDEMSLQNFDGICRQVLRYTVAEEGRGAGKGGGRGDGKIK